VADSTNKGDYNLSPTLPRVSRGDWKRRLFIVGSSLILGALAIALFEPGKQLAARMGARYHLRAAQVAQNSGDRDEALKRAAAAFRLDTGRVDALRIIVALRPRSGTRPDRAVDIATLLFRHSAANDEDRVLALSSLAATGHFQTYLKLKKELPSALQTHPDLVYHSLRMQLLQGDASAVLASLEPPLEPRFELLQIQALYRLNKPENDRMAGALVTRFFEKHSGLDDELVDEILKALAELPPSRFPLEPARRLLTWLNERPQRTSASPTLRFTLAIAKAPDEREYIIERATETLNSQSPVELLAWLERLVEYQRMLAVIDELPLDVQRTPAVHAHHVIALTRVSRFKDALELLQSRTQGIDEVKTALTKAVLCLQLGDQSGQTAAWSEALAAARQNLHKNRFIEIAVSARELGRETVAVDAIVEGSQHPSGILPSNDLVKWALGPLVRSHRAGDLQRLCNRLLQEDPESAILINNTIYLALIFASPREAPSPEWLEVMQRLHEQHPNVTGIRTTLALAYSNAGEHQKAINAFSQELNFEEARERLSASARAALALALKRGDNSDRYKQIMATIEWDRMMNDEERFFKGALDAVLPKRG